MGKYLTENGDLTETAIPNGSSIQEVQAFDPDIGRTVVVKRTITDSSNPPKIIDSWEHENTDSLREHFIDNPNPDAN